MDAWKNPIEDERGVDISQIRDMLSMSIAERAHEMVRVANLMATARETAREARLSLPYLESLREELRRQSNE